MTAKTEDVTPHAAAMRAIAEALRPFPPQIQMVLLAGELGKALSRIGPKPSKHTAVAMMGAAIEMMLDMIGRHFPKERLDA